MVGLSICISIGVVNLLYFVPIQCMTTGNDCRSRKTCGSCLEAGPHCAFCISQENDKKNLPRCDLVQNHLSVCPEGELINPKSNWTIIEVRYNVHNINTKKIRIMCCEQNTPLKDGDSSGPAVQIQPQQIHLNIRPHESQKFSLTFKMTGNYPVDLYYLMDLSNSMRDDKDTLVQLGDQIADMLTNITTNITMGFGSFVDKIVMPYVNTAQDSFSSPCSDCSAPYGYIHHLKLDSDIARFVQEVNSSNVSGNLDESEGGFDAILQAVVCNNDIGWRNYTRRLLLFSTDAESHYAGDGKLGGIVRPNDGICHLDGSGHYTESVNQDYPSISQLASIVKDNNINVIFAVTEKHVPVYSRIAEFIPGAETGKLDSNSANILQLVREVYEKITSKVTLVPSDNENITIKIYSQCKGNISKETNTCEDLKFGDTTTFDIEMEVTDCPDDPSLHERIIEFKPIGLPDKLEVNISLICQCDCEKGDEPIKNSPDCSTHGTEVCGACDCNHGFYGKKCECSNFNLTTSDNRQEQCMAPDSSVVCSGRGECVCGTCSCSSRSTNPSQVYRGTWCQCDDFDCPFSGGLICGGPDHGMCDCGKCGCSSNFTGDACGCTTSTDSCMALGNSPGGICNGQGKCVCGRCTCFENSTYGGPTCEICQSCKLNEICRQNRDCVQCVVHKSGKYNEEECNLNCVYDLNITIVNKLKGGLQVCQFKDADDCIFYFSYTFDENRELQIMALKKRDCVTSTEVDTLVIALGLISAIVIVAVILLILWKIVTTIVDKRELELFNKERSQAQWETQGNPLYKEPQRTYENPVFGILEK